MDERTYAPAHTRRAAGAVPRDFRTPPSLLPEAYRRWLEEGPARPPLVTPVTVTLWDGRQVEGYVEDGALGMVELEGGPGCSVREEDNIRVDGERRVVTGVDVNALTGVCRVESEPA